MENLNNELIEKAKQAKSAEEILDLAAQNNIVMTEEQAKAYYAQLHPTSGELSDNELDNVAGGGCSEFGRSSICPGDRVYSEDACECGCHCGIAWNYVTQAKGFLCDNCGMLVLTANMKKE